MDFSKINLLIGLPVSWEHIPLPFFESWIGFTQEFINHKIKFSVMIGSRGRQDDQRNFIINNILKYTDEYTHILFLDVDHRFPSDTIIKLLNHNKPIVSGLSFRRTAPYNPVIFNWDESIEEYETIEEWEDNSLIEVDATGGACLLVDINVLKKMDFPYFEFYSGYDRNGRKIRISEDLYFCKKLKELGYKIYVDTSCTNNHLGLLNVNETTWRNYNKLGGEFDGTISI